MPRHIEREHGLLAHKPIDPSQPTMMGTALPRQQKPAPDYLSTTLALPATTDASTEWQELPARERNTYCSRSQCIILPSGISRIERQMAPSPQEILNTIALQIKGGILSEVYVRADPVQMLAHYTEMLNYLSAGVEANASLEMGQLR